MSDKDEVEVVQGEALDQQVLRLADLTKRFGALHEFQVQQIKMWTLALLNAKSDIEYQPDIRKLFVTMKTKTKSALDLLPILSADFATCVQWLLGKDVRVAIKDATHPYLEATVLYGDFSDYPANPGESEVSDS